MIGRLSFIAALLLAPVVEAQQAGETPPTVAEIAQARAVADRLIRAADATGIFVNKTNGRVATVEHVGSRMRCVFTGAEADRIVIFPTQADGMPRADDVGCLWRDEELNIDLTTYATRYRPLPSEDAVLRDAVTAIRNRWPDAIAYDGTLASATTGNMSPPKVAAFKITVPEGPMLTLAMVSHRGEWGYKLRATGPFEDATTVSVYASLTLVLALTEVETDAAR